MSPPRLRISVALPLTSKEDALALFDTSRVSVAKHAAIETGYGVWQG